MSEFDSMAELLDAYGSEIFDKDYENKEYYKNDITEDYYSHGIKVSSCISKYDSVSTYYTLLNPKNNIHVHCTNKHHIDDICLCYERIKNGLPVKHFKHNIRNKAMKLIGYKVIYR